VRYGSGSGAERCGCRQIWTLGPLEAVNKSLGEVAKLSALLANSDGDALYVGLGVVTVVEHVLAALLELEDTEIVAGERRMAVDVPF
jgi:hypothetical protein